MIYRLKIIQNFVHSASARSLPRQSRVNNPPNHTFWRVGTGKVRSNHTFRPARSHFRGVESHKKSRLSRGREAHFACWWRLLPRRLPAASPALSSCLPQTVTLTPRSGAFVCGDSRPLPFLSSSPASVSLGESFLSDRSGRHLRLDSSSSLRHEPKTRRLCKVVQKDVQDAASRHCRRPCRTPPLAISPSCCLPGRASSGRPLAPSPVQTRPLPTPYALSAVRHMRSMSGGSRRTPAAPTGASAHPSSREGGAAAHTRHCPGRAGFGMGHTSG